MKPDVAIPPEVLDRYVRNGWWVNRSLIEYFDEAVARHPEKTALVAPRGCRMTFAELARTVERVAANLARRGIKRDDVISVHLPNWGEFTVVHLAATRLGAVTNPLLPSYRAKELSYILKFAGSVACFIPNHYRGFDYPELYRELRAGLPALRDVFVVDNSRVDGFDHFDDLLDPAAPPPPRVTVDGNDVTALIFTSGTESTPKGVMHSHNTMLYGTLMMAKLCHLTADDVVWAPSPVGHGTGFQWGIRQAVTLGAKLVMQDIWDADEALRLMEEERCTFTMAATPFAAMLLDASTLGRRDVSSFKHFTCAGAPIPRHVGERMRKEVGCNLIGMWGMTECFVGTASPPDDSDDKLWGTDGKAVEGGDVAVFDADRERQLPQGETGEMAVRGPFVSLGYFNDPVRTRETFSPEGWLFTNDLAVMDKDGYVRIVGRKKDIINRGGLKISAREIEDLLIQMPNVRQAALVPVPDPRLGEKSCAFVVPREGSVAFDDITSHLEARGVAKYKLPEHLVVLDALPMTASGKVQKFKLLESYTNKTCDVQSRA